MKNIEVHIHHHARGRHQSGGEEFAKWQTIIHGTLAVVWFGAMLWLGGAVLIGKGFPGAHTILTLSAAVAWVSWISYYCNFATEAAGFAASLAGWIASKAGRQTDLVQVASDIAELAGLQPGPDAQALATKIRQRIGVPA